MMNRRAFLKLLIGTVAVVALPIPKSMVPELHIDNGTGWQGIPYDASCGNLTPEMIEDAAQRAIENCGKPDYIIMSERHLSKFLKYQIVYENY